MLRDQTFLRDKLTDFVKRAPRSLSAISEEIGTSVVTLRNFLLRRAVLHFKTWILVDNYVAKLERKAELNINENNEKG